MSDDRGRRPVAVLQPLLRAPARAGDVHGRSRLRRPPARLVARRAGRARRRDAGAAARSRDRRPRGRQRASGGFRKTSIWRWPTAFLEIQIAEHESGHFLHRNPCAVDRRGDLLRDRAGHARVRAAIDVAAAIGGVTPCGDTGVSRRRAPRPSRGAGSPGAPVRSASARRRRACSGTVFPDWWTAREAGDVPASLLRDLNAAARGAAERLHRLCGMARARSCRGATRAHLCGRAAPARLLLRRGHWCTTPVEALLDEARDALDEAIADLDRIAGALAPGGWPEVQGLHRRAASNG